jgi:[acyl-carrier-protein] S-malonyltransferase
MSILVFPGQGSQSNKLKSALHYPSVAQTLEEAKNFLGFDVSTTDSPLSLFVESIAILELWKSEPCLFMTSEDIHNLQSKIVFVAGHSLGQYTAAVACGSITFQTGLELVRQRAQFMADAAAENPGCMAACVGHNVEQFLKRIIYEFDGVYIANYNSKTQVVISGTNDGVDLVIDECKKNGFRCIKLNVAGGFHSPLMQSANTRMNSLLDTVDFADTESGFICNKSHEIVMRGDKIKNDFHDQIISPVFWTKTVEVILGVYNNSIRIYEIGPSNVLSKLIHADTGIEVINFDSLDIPAVETPLETDTTNADANDTTPQTSTDTNNQQQ